MLERCERCGQVADKYLEFDNNLKTLSVLLCTQAVYRHLFFNVNYGELRLSDWQVRLQGACFTAIYLALNYWNHNRLLLI